MTARGALTVDAAQPELAFAGRAVATLFLILASHSLTETARDALFLSRLPVTQLPWMYLLVAVASILVARLTALTAAYLRRSVLPALLLASALISCALWTLGGTRSSAFLYVLYLWPGVFASVVIVEFWRTVSDAYTIIEAKNVFGRLGAGGTAGAVVGAGVAVAATSWFPARTLLLAAGVCMAGATGFALRLDRPRAELPDAVDAPPRTSPLTTIRRDPYLRGVAAFLFLATLMATLTDFAFKGVLTHAVRPGNLARVFATVSFAVNIGALLLQVTLVGPVIRRLGVTRSLAVLPTAVSLAATGFVAAGSLIAAIVLRVTDNTLRYSLHRATADLLYVPLSPAARARVKSVIDVLSQRVGQMAGSAAILLVLAGGWSYRAIGCGVTLLAVTAAIIAIRLTRSYLDLFRSTLKSISTDTRLALPDVDLESLTSLVAAFSSDDDAAVLAAMELAAEQRGTQVIPVVMLFHPSRAVVLRALELFEHDRRTGWGWALDRLARAAPDAEIRAAALAARAYTEDDASALRSALNDVDEHIRVTALVGLAAGGWLESGEAAKALSDTMRQASVPGHVALAAAIRHRPSPLFEATLVRLAQTADLDVRAGAALAMAESPSERFLRPLCDMLSESRLRGPARDALVPIGAAALAYLADSMDDDTLPRAIRMHLPRSISRFPAPDAVPVLWRRFLVEPDDLIRFKILRSIGRLVTEDPPARPNAAAIARAIHQVSTAGLRCARWRAALEHGASSTKPSATGDLLLRMLVDKQVRATEIIFRLLALTDPREDFERIYRGLHGSRMDRASGRELLQGVVRTNTRDIVLALLEEPGDPARLARLDGDAAADGGYDATVASIIEASNGPLRTIAIRHAEEAEILVTV